MIMSEQRGGFWKKLAVVGPAAIMVSSSMGPGTIASCMLGGSSEGYRLLWIVAASGFMGAAVCLLGGWVYAVTNKTPVEIIEETVSNWVGYPLFVICGLAVYYVIIAEGNLLAHVTLLMIPAAGSINDTVIAPLVILGIAIIFIFGFKRVVMLCSMFTGLMAVMFLVNLFFVDISWGDLLNGFIPSAPTSKYGFLALAGILGGAAAGTNLVGYSYIVKNRGWDRPGFFPDMKRDQIFFYGILFGLFSAGAFISGAAVLYGRYIVRGATEAAIALEPMVGTASLWFFLIGLFTAVFTTIGAFATMVCYFFADLFGLPPDLNDSRFKIMLFISIMLAVIGPFVGGLPAMQFVSLAMVGLLLAGIFFMGIYLYAANSRKIMGEHTNGWIFNVILGIIYLINLVFGLMAVVKVVSLFV